MPSSRRPAVGHRISALAGSADGPGPNIGEAAAAVRAAEDAIGSARATNAEIDRRRADAAAELPRRKDAIADAAERVLAEESLGLVRQIAAELDDLQRRVVDRGKALSFLMGLWPRNEADRELLSASWRIDQLPSNWQLSPPATAPTEAALRAVLAELHSNPEALVPGKV